MARAKYVSWHCGDNALAQRPGTGDALIQPYSGHASRQSPEIYSRLALADTGAIGNCPL
jgi:hypothetical protein